MLLINLIINNMSTTITAQNLAKQKEDCLIVDVRTPIEYAEGYIENSVNMPLGKFTGSEDIFNKNQKIVFVCKSGVRASKACGVLAGKNVCLLEGGFDEWVKAKLPFKQNKITRFPVINQMQMIVGAMVAIFSGLSLFFNPMFAVGSLIIGCALFFAGFSGFCLLIKILEKMPWNKV